MRARHSAVNLSMHARLSDHQLRKLQHRRLCKVSTVHVYARYEGGKPLNDAGLVPDFTPSIWRFLNAREFLPHCRVRLQLRN